MCIRDSPPGAGNDFADPKVEALSASFDGAYATYTLSVDLKGAAANCYTLYGKSSGSMEIPAAYQVAAPFGSNTGGTNQAFWSVANNAALGYAQYDSWLSAGIIDGDAAGAISSIGILWDEWTESNGISVNDGAVFWMSPGDAPGGNVVIAQLTVGAADTGTMTAGLQGRSSGWDTGADDWSVDQVAWMYKPPPAPAPPPSPPPPPSGGSTSLSVVQPMIEPGNCAADIQVGSPLAGFATVQCHTDANEHAECWLLVTRADGSTLNDGDGFVPGETLGISMESECMGMALGADATCSEYGREVLIELEGQRWGSGAGSRGCSNTRIINPFRTPTINAPASGSLTRQP